MLSLWGIRKTIFRADNIKSSNMITEEIHEIEISVIIEKNLATYEYDSFAIGYHVHMDIWNPLIGEILNCKRERANKVDKNAVAIIPSNLLGMESVVGHIPRNIPKFSAMFLRIPFTSVEVEVVGKMLNRGGSYGMEIPVKHRFYGQEKIVQ